MIQKISSNHQIQNNNHSNDHEVIKQKDRTKKVSQKQQTNKKQSNKIPELQFEKNYPKNIFIALLEQLNRAGYRIMYEQCVGSKQQIEQKNVVSLNLLYNLLSQKWFLQKINKNQLLANISHKILMNCKIKKKLFHLLLVDFLLGNMLIINNNNNNIQLEQQLIDLKNFKRRVNQMAKNIPNFHSETHHIFQYPNSIVYLLVLFIQILQQKVQHHRPIDKLTDQLNHMQLAGEDNVKKNYKQCVRDIVHLLSRKAFKGNNVNNCYEQMKQCLQNNERQIRQKYNLCQGVPNWKYFLQEVVIKCLDKKQQQQKITNSQLNQWITKYKQKQCPIINNNNNKNQINSIINYIINNNNNNQTIN